MNKERLLQSIIYRDNITSTSLNLYLKRFQTTIYSENNLQAITVFVTTHFSDSNYDYIKDLDTHIKSNRFDSKIIKHVGTRSSCSKNNCNSLEIKIYIFRNIGLNYTRTQIEKYVRVLNYRIDQKTALSGLINTIATI
jgi:hypothetical protein